MPPNKKGRPPGTIPGTGPQSTKTQPALATVTRIGRPADAPRGTYSVSDLPPRIAANTTIDNESGCWVVGPGNGITIDRDGYARYRGEGVHRIAYRALIGEIPDDLPIIDHVQTRGCIWRNCAFGGHLEAVTVRTNTLRGGSFAAVNYFKTHCSACGEPYDLLNCYFKPNGHRDCRACIRRRVREYGERVKAGQPVTRREVGRAA